MDRSLGPINCSFNQSDGFDQGPGVLLTVDSLRIRLPLPMRTTLLLALALLPAAPAAAQMPNFAERYPLPGACDQNCRVGRSSMDMGRRFERIADENLRGGSRDSKCTDLTVALNNYVLAATYDAPGARSSVSRVTDKARKVCPRGWTP